MIQTTLSILLLHALYLGLRFSILKFNFNESHMKHKPTKRSEENL